MMKFIFLLLVISLSGCNGPTNVNNRINDVIDSLNVNNNIVSFHIKDMKDYWLYTISNDIGLIYDGEGNLLISEIRRMNGKNVVVYSTPKKAHYIDEETIQQIEKSYKPPYHTVIWYFAITKDGRKEVLIQPDNSDVMPYEIPEIRYFLNPLKDVNDYECIADYISILMNDSLNSINIDMHLNLYNHSRNVVEDVPNDFLFVQARDTFRFRVDCLPLYKAYIDDTLWIANTSLKKRFYLHLEMSGDKIISNFKDKKAIKDILNKSILIKGKKNKIELLIPSEVQIHFKKNGKWLE